MIKFAHILPANYVPQLVGDYQLILPGPLMSNNAYKKAYIGWMRSKYTILDNGAAESEQVDLSSLLTLARVFNVDEIALPDVMGDCLATMQRSAQAVNNIIDRNIYLGTTALGYVAQGNDYDSALKGTKSMLRLYGEIKTVYIPRLLITKDTRDIRVRLAQTIKEAYPEVNIHMFGLHQNYPGELKLMRNYRDYIRGVDSSAAACHAEIGLRPTLDWYSQPVVRPKAFFARSWDSKYEARLTAYVEQLDSWLR